MIENYPESILVPPALGRIGDSYRQMERDEEAIRSFRAVVGEYPEFEEVDGVQFKIAEYFYSKERYEEALPEFRTLLRSFPQSLHLSNAYFFTGICLDQLERFSEASFYYAQFIHLFPESSMRGEVYYRWAKSLYNQGKFEQAIGYYDEALKILKKTEIYLEYSLYNKGLCYENLKDWERTEETLKDFVDRFPESKWISQAYLKLADSFFHRDLFAQARANYGYVIKIAEENEVAVEAQFGMATCWFNEKQFDKAVVEYLKVPLLYPMFKGRAIEARFRAGLSYEGLGKKEEARKEYERILQEKDLEEEWTKRVREKLEELKGG